MFKSQKGQDEWLVYEVFKHKENGFFVDLAASDGHFYSNTWILEKKYKWKGICIEPNPTFYRKLIKCRSSINIQACIDDSIKDLLFLTFQGMLGGIIDFDTNNNLSLTKNEIQKGIASGKILRLTTKTLEQVLDENNAPNIIDYLSLDVEGAEQRILENFPFNKYTFLSMSIERPTPKLHRIFLENGYVFVKNHMFEAFYIHESLSNASEITKQPHTQIPAKRGFFLEHQL